MRLKATSGVHYDVEDASGDEYCSAIRIGQDLNFRYAQWSIEEREESSNYRNLNNLAIIVE